MKVNVASFLTSAEKPEHYLVSNLPEIAFAGRSNVGKSSLINSLTGRNGLVKVSKTPGKTRLINFFDIDGKLTFVDLPGYGFANVPVSVKRQWGVMIETFLRERKQLRAVVTLLDCRRRPNDDDRAMLEWLKYNKITPIIVFTKIDKVGKSIRQREIKKALDAIDGLYDPNQKPIVYSSLKGEGKRELWAVIKRLTNRQSA